MFSYAKRANCSSCLKWLLQSYYSKNLGRYNHRLSPKCIVSQAARQFTTGQEYKSQSVLHCRSSILKFSSEYASISIANQMSKTFPQSYCSYSGSYPKYDEYKSELKDLYSLMGDDLNLSDLKVIEPSDFEHWCNLVPESKRSYIKDTMVSEKIIVTDTKDMYPDTWSVDSFPQPSGLKYAIQIVNHELPKSDWVNVYVNGSYVPTPQESGIGVIILHPSKEFEIHGETISGKNSFDVELKAVRAGMRLGRTKGYKKLRVISCSKGAVKATNEIKPVDKAFYGTSITKIRKQKKEFEALECEHIHQFGNMGSKALANMARLGLPIENGPDVDVEIQRLTNEVPCFHFEWEDKKRKRCLNRSSISV